MQKDIGASNIVDLYFKEILKLYGVSKSITSDRDTKFISHFWRSLWKRLGIELKFSTPYHLLTDTQTEVVNRSLSNLRQVLAGSKPKQWDSVLSQAEFAFNRSRNCTF